MKIAISVKSAIVAVALTIGAGSAAFASEILEGFDLFETQPGTFVDLSDFGLGVVLLEGVPFGPETGTTDTIVKREQGINPFDPPNGMGTVEIELLALHLKSVAPVQLSPPNGPFADLHMTINKDGIIPGLPQPDTLMGSIGQMEIRHDSGPAPTDNIGGTWDSCFGELTDPPPCDSLGVADGGIFADAIFTVVGGDPGDPDDILLHLPAPRQVLKSDNCDWQHQQRLEDPRPAPGEDPPFPAGFFFATECHFDGPHAVGPPFTPPSCYLSGYNPGPPKSIEVTTQDLGSGLVSITILNAENATVAIPPFTPGTNAPVVVVATKDDPLEVSRVLLKVCDMGSCTKCDPVLTLVIRDRGRPVRETFYNLPQEESFVTVINGDPGLKNLDIIVNGEKYKVRGLHDNDEMNMDVSSSMVAGDNNTITLIARGKPGTSATVVISD